METPKEFLEGYDPQIKEVGYDNYTYTPQQVIDRLEAYRKELVKESDSLPCVSERKIPTEEDARNEINEQDKAAGYPEPSDYSDGYDKGFIDCVKWIKGKFYSR